MPLSYADYTGDGSTSTFAVPFDYLQKAHVSVTVNSALQVDGTAYDWSGDKQIQFKGGYIPASGAAIRILRDTPENDQIVQWADGSYIVAEDLNESDLQWLYNIQELQDEIGLLDGTVNGEALKEIQGAAPIMVDASVDNQRPVVSIDETKEADNLDALTSDTKVLSGKAIDAGFKQIVGAPPAGRKVGQINIDTSKAPPALFYWTGSSWVQMQGGAGPQGPPGPAPGLQSPPASATNVALNADGSLGTATASVQQDPATKDLKFLFGIPVGQKGDKGDASTVPGPPPGLQSPAASATTVANKVDGTLGDATASVTQDGSGDLLFTFGVPAGVKGDQGPQGPQGSGVTYLGAIDTTTATEPSSPSNGDFYINTVTGTSSWTGLGAIVDGARVIWNDATSQWDMFTPSYATDLDYVADPLKGTITNTSGKNADLPLVDSTNAGLMSPGYYDKLTNIPADADKTPDLSVYLKRGKVDNVSELTNDAGYITSSDVPTPATPTLQQVLDTGNTSTTDLWIGDNGQTAKLLNTGIIESSGTIRNTARTITAGSFDLATGNHWSCGAITVPNPTNAVAGVSGLILITAGPVVWSSNFKFPGGSAPTISNYPSIIPFYVQDGSTILMGNVSEGIS